MAHDPRTSDSDQIKQSLINLLNAMGLPEDEIKAALRELSEDRHVADFHDPLANQGEPPSIFLHSEELLNAMVEAAIDLSQLPEDLRRAIEDRRRKNGQSVRRTSDAEVTQESSAEDDENVISLYDAGLPPDRDPPKPSPFNP